MWRGKRDDRNAEKQEGERSDPNQGGNKGRLLHPSGVYLILNWPL
jgi:hypothetical protein